MDETATAVHVNWVLRAKEVIIPFEINNVPIGASQPPQ